ncbi:hypothetical protein KFK09_004072 [Dendrobium nobile]|uniref:Uncharacterized protein n=1 Tax=Dendrobium nobile TaxID=94219 RepID=A0A8T3C2Z8_DENNO|nr:hypothetical protein KFK09_004072 [Dendrobium nobile]
MFLGCPHTTSPALADEISKTCNIKIPNNYKPLQPDFPWQTWRQESYYLLPSRAQQSHYKCVVDVTNRYVEEYCLLRKADYHR